MSMERSKKIRELFERAVELPPGERTAFLNEACGDDSEMRKELERLLAADDMTDGTFRDDMDRLRKFALNLRDNAEQGRDFSSQEGNRIGPYLLIAEIGRGGMGVVYQACRVDGLFGADLAIKLLGPTLDERGLRYVKRERQVLASLNHPSIVRFYDSGELGDYVGEGRSYLVMERIVGSPIDEWCDVHGLNIDQRLDLILSLCDALSQAHRNLIVHCDLKPSNILVDKEGIPKLLDFGIAKYLDQRSTSEQTTLQRPMTPNYASIEQIQERPITTHTDIYQVGLILYLLLAGDLPHQRENLSQAEIERLLSDSTPQSPSSALRKFREAMRGQDGKRIPAAGVDSIGHDLDAIVLKALRPDPAKNYISIEQFAEDLRRYRVGEPVAARGDQLRYRAAKFIFRNWKPLLAATMLVLFLAAFAVDRTLRTMELNLRTVELEEQRQTQETIKSFMVNFLRYADPGVNRGEEITVLQAIEKGEEEIVRRFRGRPGLEALVRAEFGRIYSGVGEVAAAEAQFRKALSLADEKSPEFVDILADLAKVLVHIDGAEAEATALKAVEIGHELRLDDASLFKFYHAVTYVLCWQRKYVEAEPFARETLSIAGLLEHSDDILLAESLTNLALVEKRVHQELGKSKDLYEKALMILSSLHGPVHPNVANTQNQLALLAGEMGDVDSAIDWHERVLSTRQSLYPEGHWEIAQSLSHLAALHRSEGRFDEAESRQKKAVEIFEKDLGQDHSRTIDYRLHLAWILVEDERSVEAVALTEGELRRPDREGLYGISRGQRAWAESLRGAALILQGDEEEGRLLLQQNFDVLEETYRNYDKNRIEAARSWLSQ